MNPHLSRSEQSVRELRAPMKPANDEMVQGYWDGFDPDSPEPSANRSRSYRHGFANGRADKSGKSRGLTFDELSAAADLAMHLDEYDAMRSA